MFRVRVYLVNDDGDKMTVVAEDETVTDAIVAAEQIAAERTGDDSYVMSDWGAA